MRTTEDIAGTTPVQNISQSRSIFSPWRLSHQFMYASAHSSGTMVYPKMPCSALLIIASVISGAVLKSISAEEAAPAPEPEKALTLEEVRAILAEKSRDGFTAQIRDLLLKYGAKKLSEVDPVSYKALVADAEVLGNA